MGEKSHVFIEWGLKDKLKYVGGIVAITGAVYVSFKYLFEIVWPFLIAYLIALAIEKPVNALAKCLKGKKALSSTIIVIILTAALAAGLGYLAYLGFMEIRTFVAKYDYYMIGIRQRTAKMCFNVDSILGLYSGCTLKNLEGLVNKAGAVINSADDGQIVVIAKNILFGSVPVVTHIILVIGAIIVCFISVVYLSNVLDEVRQWRMKSVFREEVCVVTAAMNRLLNVYFRVQLEIMAINGAVCVAGLWLIRNPYAVVLGVLIGIVDALPFFGTGTILIPWVIAEVLMKQWKQAAVLLTIYLITYFVREIMESRCMGSRLGVSSFIMLMVIFVGIMVYGIFGFILGPVSYVIIKALVQYLKTVLEHDRL
ncbi:MAG: AI-2E family transporter [Eubacteriales bacterium]|nr:AI-2E family transporter [Eubacteriales bacterium]